MLAKNISSQRIRVLLVSGVLAVSFIVLLLAPLAAWRWVEQTPFPGFALDPNLVVSGGVSDGSWQAAQLEPPVAFPARVTAVDGLSVNSNREFWTLMAYHGVGNQVAISFEEAVEAWPLPETAVLTPRTETFTLTPFDQNSLWILFWLPYMVSVMSLGLGIWVFWSRPQAEPVQLFTLFVSLGAILMAGLFDQASTQVILPLWTAALPAFGLLNLLLVAVFPHEMDLLRRQPYLRLLVYLTAIGLALWGVWAVYWSPDPWAFLAAWRVALLVSGVTLISSIFLIIYRTRWSPSPLVRQQGNVIAIGAIIAFSPLLLFILTSLTPLHFDWVVPALYIPPLVAYPLVIGYALVSYQLLGCGDAYEKRQLAAIIAGCGLANG
jgi:hypothetical protein